jgi:hypothetical protein
VKWSRFSGQIFRIGGGGKRAYRTSTMQAPYMRCCSNNSRRAAQANPGATLFFAVPEPPCGPSKQVAGGMPDEMVKAADGRVNGKRPSDPPVLTA